MQCSGCRDRTCGSRVQSADTDANAVPRNENRRRELNPLLLFGRQACHRGHPDGNGSEYGSRTRPTWSRTKRPTDSRTRRAWAGQSAPSPRTAHAAGARTDADAGDRASFMPSTVDVSRCKVRPAADKPGAVSCTPVKLSGERKSRPVPDPDGRLLLRCCATRAIRIRTRRPRRTAIAAALTSSALTSLARASRGISSGRVVLLMTVDAPDATRQSSFRTTTAGRVLPAGRRRCTGPADHPGPSGRVGRRPTPSPAGRPTGSPRGPSGRWCPPASGRLSTAAAR